MLILHGLFGSLDNWMTLGKRLSEHYEVWLIDQRNHGRSPHSDKMSYEIMAEDLHEFIQQHQLSDVVVLGHSLGGKTAMQHSMKYSDEISKLVVADMAPRAYEHDFDEILEGLKAVKPSSISSRKDAEQKLGKHINNWGICQFLLKNLNRKKDETYEWRFNLAVLEREMQNIRTWEINGAPMEKPTLFIKGENSNYISDKDGIQIKELFPNSKIEGIEGAGHWLHAEKPDEFYSLLKDFMES